MSQNKIHSAKWGMQIAGMIFQTRSKARGCGIEKKSKTVARKLEILCQNIRLSVRILWLCLRAWLVAWLITLTKLLTKLFPMKTIPLKVIETEPMLSQKKSPILSERNIVRISSSFRTKVILILTHILRQRLLRRQASLPGVLLGGRFHLLDHHKRTIHIRVHKWKFHYILNFSTKDFHSIFCLRKLFINLAGFIRNKAASFYYEGDTILGKGA